MQRTGSASQKRLLSLAQLPSGFWRDITFADSSFFQLWSPTVSTPAAESAKCCDQGNKANDLFMRTLLDFSYGRARKGTEDVVELRIVQNRLTVGWGWRGIRDRGSGSRLGLWFGYRLIWQWRQPATGPLRREIWRFRHRHCMAIPHALIADP